MKQTRIGTFYDNYEMNIWWRFICYYNECFKNFMESMYDEY